LADPAGEKPPVASQRLDLRSMRSTEPPRTLGGHRWSAVRKPFLIAGAVAGATGALATVVVPTVVAWALQAFVRANPPEVGEGWLLPILCAPVLLPAEMISRLLGMGRPGDGMGVSFVIAVNTLLPFVFVTFTGWLLSRFIGLREARNKAARKRL